MIRITPIITNRFLLRQLDIDDCSNVFRILKDKDTRRYLNIPNIREEEQVRELLDDYLKGYSEGSKYPFAIVGRNDGKFVGVFLIKVDLFDEDCYEYTVYIDKSFWNQGVYSEVLPEMVRYSFEVIGTGNFRGFVMENNKASAHVLTKNGFQLERVFSVDGLPEPIYSFLMKKDFYMLNYRNNLIRRD